MSLETLIKTKEVKVGPVHLVEWHDAHSASGWFSKKEVDDFIKKERCICINIGWIIHESKDEIVMACRTMKYSEDGDSQY